MPEGKPIWGGTCPKIEIEEVDVRLTGGKESEKDPEEWGKEIRKAVMRGAYIFSDGSLLESGNVKVGRLWSTHGGQMSRWNLVSGMWQW